MRRAAVLLLALSCAHPRPAQPGPAARPAPMPSGTPLELGLAGTAKVLCSAVFISQRVPQEAWENSAQAFMPDEHLDAGHSYAIDVPRQTVTVSVPSGLARRARFVGDQGCIIGEPRFTPRVLERKGSGAAPWPMGDEGVELDPRFAPATDAAFADPAALTAAFVVVHRGRIVAERYGPGVTRDTALESWSMGKSITATLLGLRVKDGTFPDVNAPAPVERWANDARKNIRLVDLLRMSGGLSFSSSFDPDWKPGHGVPDHTFIYTGAVDAFEYSLDKPAQFPPNTEGRYRNCDPLVLGALLKRAAGDDYLAWPQRALFDKLGMRHMWLETDPYGNFLLTGYDYGTARDWARLGLLYAQDGVWQSERLLPEGWTKLVSTPAPAWKKPEYGGLFWLNRARDWPLPEEALIMVGAGGQKVFVVPSQQLVVVRLGHTRGGPAHARSLKLALERVMRAVEQQ